MAKVDAISLVKLRTATGPPEPPPFAQQRREQKGKGESGTRTSTFFSIHFPRSSADTQRALVLESTSDEPTMKSVKITLRKHRTTSEASGKHSPTVKGPGVNLMKTTPRNPSLPNGAASLESKFRGTVQRVGAGTPESPPQVENLRARCDGCGGSPPEEKWWAACL